jgi:hypothetical protein
MKPPAPFAGILFPSLAALADNSLPLPPQTGRFKGGRRAVNSLLTKNFFRVFYISVG